MSIVTIILVTLSLALTAFAVAQFHRSTKIAEANGKLLDRVNDLTTELAEVKRQRNILNDNLGDANSRHMRDLRKLDQAKRDFDRAVKEQKITQQNWAIDMKQKNHKLEELRDEIKFLKELHDKDLKTIATLYKKIAPELGSYDSFEQEEPAAITCEIVTSGVTAECEDLFPEIERDDLPF